MTGTKKRILLAPLDPVHDVGIRLIGKGLKEQGYEIITLPPDITIEEVVAKTEEKNADIVLVSRTIGYQVAEIMAKLVDIMDASGMRQKVKIGLGGMAIRPELAQELGFDGGFGSDTKLEEVIAFIEGEEYEAKKKQSVVKLKDDETKKYDYLYKDQIIGALLEEIAEQAIGWYKTRTSPGIKRAKIREEIILTERKIAEELLSAEEGKRTLRELKKEYAANCDERIAKFYTEGQFPLGVKQLNSEEIQEIKDYALQDGTGQIKVQHIDDQPKVFVQYGTGCPLMDIAHIKAAEAWGADGILHFDPSWEARSEGLLEGYLSQQDTGTLYTSEIISLIKECINSGTIWNLRAHRGLNTAETVVLAGLWGADQVKMNPIYGGLAGGTDPERLMLDNIEAINYAAKYDLSFDVPIGHELSGVPSYKAFAGMLIVAAIGLKLGARPILNPQFCFSPNVMLEGQMEENYVDYNVARIEALRGIINAPIRVGEPVAFMTHTEERVQSAVTTALHANLASSLHLDAVTIASTDEAYSGGPITATSRIDTLRAVKETLRFFGRTTIQPTGKAEQMQNEIMEGILEVLEKVKVRGDLVAAVYEGLLGDEKDGVYPGRAGKGTVSAK